MLAGILHVTILTIVCLLVFLGMLPVLFATGFCERVTHFLDIRFAGGSSSTSKDLFLDAVNTISSGVSGEGSEVDATKVEFRTGAATKSSSKGLEVTNVELISVEFKTGGKEARESEVSVVEMLSGLWELVGSELETSKRLEFGDGK